MLKKIILSLLLLHLSIPFAQAKLKTETIEINNIEIQAEIADQDNTRRLGLMNRTKLADDSGMLFIFEHNARHCFWMKNTLIPLSIAFIDETDTIVDIQEMEAESLQEHFPPAKVNKALEMNSGWFANNNIKAGMRIN